MFFSEVFRKLSKQNIAFIIWNKHHFVCCFKGHVTCTQTGIFGININHVVTCSCSLSPGKNEEEWGREIKSFSLIPPRSWNLQLVALSLILRLQQKVRCKILKSILASSFFLLARRWSSPTLKFATAIFRQILLNKISLGLAAGASAPLVCWRCALPASDQVLCLWRARQSPHSQ